MRKPLSENVGPEMKMKIRKTMRIVFPVVIAIASFPFLNLAAFHVWAAGGPPSPYPEWHVQWANIFATFWFCTLLLAVLVNLLLKPPEHRKATIRRTTPLTAARTHLPTAGEQMRKP